MISKPPTEDEKADLKARYDDYVRQHVEACARGEHVWRTPKGQLRYPVLVQECRHCGAQREISAEEERRSRTAPIGSATKT